MKYVSYEQEAVVPKMQQLWRLTPPALPPLCIVSANPLAPVDHPAASTAKEIVFAASLNSLN